MNKYKEALRGAIKAIKLFIEADRMSSFETSILTDEMRKEIAAYKLAAQEALQSESEQPTSPSIEKMAHEYAKRKSINGVDYKIVKKDFIEGFKANNSLEELENWIGEFEYVMHKQDILNKIQELKTKQ